MSCNGCRVLRKGCSDSCILRPCLQWIEGAEAQGHATVFVAKFFGRAGLMSFISAVPENQRPALFRSLLYEACGRTVNPVYGAVGLLWSGNWQICQSAVETVLRGGILRALSNPVMASSIPNNKAFSDQAKIALPDLKRGDPNLLHLEKPVAVKAETLELEDFSDFTHKGIESVQKMDKKQQIHQIWEASGRRVRHHLSKIDENGYGDTSVIDLDLTLCSHPHKKGLQLPSSSCCNSVSSSEGSVTSLDTGDAMSVFALHNRPKMLPLLQKMEPL